jgi:hypothetical protein
MRYCDHCKETAPTVELLDFAKRHFNGDGYFSGTKVEMAEQEFMVGVQDAIMHSELKEGYAPFVKHLWLSNFSPTKLSYVKLEEGMNVQTGYKCRSGGKERGELRYLDRWVNNFKAPNAHWFDVILYTKEQLIEEGMECDADYGIVSINAEMYYGVESPMSPETLERNAMGKEYGGNGIPVDQEAHEKAVEFWSKHIRVVA